MSVVGVIAESVSKKKNGSFCIARVSDLWTAEGRIEREGGRTAKIQHVTNPHWG